jgi:superfamily II DNA or RNA helicase
MDEYILIELKNWFGTKNIICHLLAPRREISLNEVEETRSYLVAIDGGVRYCLTGNPNIVDPTSEYVIQTDHTPTKQKLLDGTVKQKKWVKHPKMAEHTPEDVLNSWTNQFVYKEEVDEEHPGLRKPQLGALHAVLGHFLAPNDVATIVLPTGTGKTETMLSAMVAGRCKKLLVTVPSSALRNQLFGKFKTLGVLKDPEFGIVGDSALFPIVGVINTAFETADELRQFIEKCNVVITTMQIIDSAPQEQQDVYVSAFTNVFVDEAHHIVAASWRKFADRFPKNRLVQFTATPFRNDGQRLDGKIIFNYPLKQAQEDGYYRTINFLPIREYDDERSDRAIAAKAIEKLREDLAAGYHHILMARCESKSRAVEVCGIYQELCPDLNPVVLYSGHPQYRENYGVVLRRKAKVIVCVNMLGEGFDLPELKIAAFHDIRKSLPVTLQFAGRFTRTSRDANLGNASFIANLADITVQQELDNLYEEDADWNILLANANDNRVNNQEEYKQLLDGFRNGVSSKIPVSSVYPKLSAVVYKSYTDTWHPDDFLKGIRGFDDLDFTSYDINDREKLVVAVFAKEQNIEGIHVKDVKTLVWSYLVLFWDSEKNLLFINSSDNGSVYKNVANHVIGEDGREPDLIRGIDVFRTFYNVMRTKLRNVGLKVYLGKDVRFRMHAGRDVERVLSDAEQRNSEKAFVVGDGFEEGERTSIGASFKGRIWSLNGAGDILTFKNWCLEQGKKLTNEAIDGNQILTETLIPKTIHEMPQRAVPFAIDWDTFLWAETENHFTFNLLGAESHLYDTDMELREDNPVQDNAVFFAITNGIQRVEFKLELFKNRQNPDNVYSDYQVVKLTEGVAIIKYGRQEVDLMSFLYNYAPTIFFTDGSSLCGTEYIELKTPPAIYNRDRIDAWDWQGVNLAVESQGVAPIIRMDSIQFHVIQKLMNGNYDIIYDDDNAGEIADVIALKQENNEIHIELYHLKFAQEGRVTGRIGNFYEVCGQAQKSSNWKYKEPEEMMNHLLRRETKREGGVESTRIQKGDHETLVKLLKLAKKKIPVKYSIYIVQPGASKAGSSDEILTLLGVTDSFLKERTGIDLKVITSE